MNQDVIEKTAQKVKIYGDLDEVASKLQTFKKAEINVYVDFNGKKLYSLLDDLDSCYLKVTGQNKADFEETERVWKENYDRKIAEEKAYAIKMIPTYIAKGKELIYTPKQSEWEQCIKNIVSNNSNCSCLENAIAAMTELEKSGNFNSAKEIINSANHLGAAYGLVMRIIVNFSKMGPEFYEYMEPEYSKSLETKKVLEQIKRENQEYQQSEPNSGSQFGS